MDKKKQLLLSIGLVLILVLMIVGISYAAFKFTGLGNKPNTITTGAITMEYTESTNTISMTGALPTTDVTGKVRLTKGEYFDFTIKSSIKGNANINWEIAAEDITPSSAKKMAGKNIKLYLTKLNGDNEEEVMAPKVYSADTTANTYTGRPSGIMSLAKGTMSASETTNYRLRMYVDENYNPQGDGGGLSFSVKINAYGKTGEKMPVGSKIKAYVTLDDLNNYNWPSTDFHTDAYKSKITSIITKNDNIVPATATESWDISEAGDGSVMAYVEKTDEVLEPEPTNVKIYSNKGETKDILETIYATPLEGTDTNYAYKLTIGGEDGIIANENMIGYFSGFNKMTLIDLSALDTSKVTNMVGMFAGCSRLISLDVSNFDTSEVTDMASMFSECGRLTSLDVSKFDTSEVTDMARMFYECSSLTSLDVSKFDTSKVTDMSSMFYNCNRLTGLDLRNFNTSQVTNMDSMFNSCSSLTSLDLRNFNTSQVTNMARMFYECSRLTSLDVSKFDTSQVTNMSGMFSSCRSLTSLDVSKFDTSKVIDMSYMFCVCSSLTSLDVSKFDTSKVTNMDSMFNSCSSLTSLDLRNFNTLNVTNMMYMFHSCSSLTSLDVSSFDTSKVTIMNWIFSECSNLTSLDLRSFDTSKTTDMRGMFDECSKLTKIMVSNKWVIGSSTDVVAMFYKCGTNHVTIV